MGKKLEGKIPSVSDGNKNFKLKKKKAHGRENSIANL